VPVGRRDGEKGINPVDVVLMAESREMDAEYGVQPIFRKILVKSEA
jgi:hypothetical protein